MKTPYFNKSASYRPEIDGLRAIAVLGVVIFHADFSIGENTIFLSGGYFGVDVFFVISGFLITTIIHDQLVNKNFSIFDFFLRRARRLFPALFTVLIATVPFAWFLFLPQEMIDFSSSILSTLFFYSNFHFYSEDPYWATASKLKPLLHTWSLAVEEQYYLIAPFLMIALFRRKANMHKYFLILGAISLLLALLFTPRNPDATFFLLPSRAWELLAGAISAMVALQRSNRFSLWISSVVNPIAISALILCFIFIDDQYLHPHLITLVPVVATSVFIVFAHPYEIITKIFSSKILVGIGLISYPLYLWHYPIFAFANAANIELNHYIKIILIFCAMFLALSTFILIERPIRFQKQNTRKKLLLTSLVFSAMFGFSVQGIISEGYKIRLAELYSLYSPAEPDNRILQRATWRPQREHTEFGEGMVNVLIHGDSHAKDLFNALYLNRELIPEFDFLRSRLSFSDNRNQTCFADNDQELNNFLDSEIYQSSEIIIISDLITEEWNIECLETYLEKVDLSEKRHILFSTQRFNIENSFINRVNSEIDRLRRNNHLIDLYYDRNPLQMATISDLVLLSSGDISVQDGERYQFRSIHEESLLVNNQLMHLASRFGIEYVNKYDYLCDQPLQSCTIFDEFGRKIYFDNTHLTLAGALLMGRRIIGRIFDHQN